LIVGQTPTQSPSVAPTRTPTIYTNKNNNTRQSSWGYNCWSNTGCACRHKTLGVQWIATQPYGQTHAQLCSEGTYCKTGAFLASGSGLCFTGHYCPPNSSFPFVTPVGNYASALGSVAPTLYVFQVHMHNPSCIRIDRYTCIT